MRKVTIIGTSGSGKTTLGKKVAQRLQLEAIDLDELNWEPGWQVVPPTEFDSRLQRALLAPGWVVSGNYSRVQENYLAQADTLVWLDYSFGVVLGRVLRRTFWRVVLRQPCCNGNFESLGRTFSRDSIVLWMIKNYHRRKRHAERLFDADTHPHLRKLRFRSPRQAQQWLESLRKEERA